MADISIVLPALNMGSLVGETIDSILSQTVRDWELLLIDDGSRDDTRAVMAKYAKADPRIRVLCFPSNLGISAARNIGTQQTESPYLVHTDADDVMEPDHLARHLEAIQDVDVSYSDVSVFMEAPKESVDLMQTRLPAGKHEALLHCIVDALELGSFWRPPGAVMVRREADTKARQLHEVWDRRIPTAGEMQYYACLVNSGAVFKPTEQVSFHWRRHPNSDGASSSVFHLSLGYLWMLEFWLKELGPDPILVQRKISLMESLRIAANVEIEFAKV